MASRGERAWEALEEIRRQQGVDDFTLLNPEAVVEAARPDDHPLHDRFTWDDTEAARQHRISEARNVIRSVRLIDAGHPEAPRSLRAYVNLRANTGPGGYVPVANVVLDDALRQVVLDQMRREWLNFRRRYQDMSEFAAMVLESMAEELPPAANGG